MKNPNAITRPKHGAGGTDGDPNFKGNGIIKCRVCGDPLADHPMRPCEKLAERLLYVGEKGIRGVPSED